MVDTVKYPFFNELVEKVSEFTEPEKLDYVIINHVEQDHSSSYPMIMNLAKNATIVATQRGKDALIKHYGDFPNEFKVAKTGDEIKIGKRTLRFIEAPMIHWPDSMMTYVV